MWTGAPHPQSSPIELQSLPCAGQVRSGQERGFDLFVRMTIDEYMFKNIYVYIFIHIPSQCAAEKPCNRQNMNTTTNVCACRCCCKCKIDCGCVCACKGRTYLHCYSDAVSVLETCDHLCTSVCVVVHVLVLALTLALNVCFCCICVSFVLCSPF